MNKIKIKILIFVAIVVIIGGVLLVLKTPFFAPKAAVDVRQNVENYLRANISKLSPVQAVLGGTWYVVSMTTDLVKNSGTVVYEDGHIKETKNFSYTTNDKGEIASLTIINSNDPIACTQEAKLCPDGSAVSRTGPNCEFAPCPTPAKSGITGKVTLGPTCPVERIPPDPNCAPKSYSTLINIMQAGSTKAIKTIQSDSKGIFGVDLDPGTYTLQALGGNILPRCPATSVTVASGQYATVNISCDTGIR